MGDLPWLLVYGPFVWPAFVAFAGLVACAVAWSDARRGGHLSADWGRRAFARPAREALADGARSVVTGTLSVEGDAVPGFDAPAPAAVTTARADRRPDSLKDALDRAASVRAPALSLRCDDGTVVHLEGPVAVLAGSREVWTGCTLPRLDKALRARVEAADEAGAAMLTQHHVVLASVQAGDRVQAFGKLVARQDIRTVAVRWTLAPAPEPDAGAGDAALAAIPLVHDGGSPRVSGPLPRAVWRAAALAALGAFVGVTVLGEYMNLTARGGGAGSGTVASRPDQPLAFRSVSNDLVTAATPFRRRAAASRIAHQARRFPKSDREVGALAALWSLAEDCAVSAEVLARAGRHEAAMDAAERCGTPRARWVGAQVASLAGYYPRAARMLDGIDAPPEGHRAQDVTAALAYLHAGNDERAAYWMERIAHPDNRDAFNPAFGQAARCAAAALSLRAGRAGAERELRAGFEGTQGWRCALFLADAKQGAARLAVLDEAERTLGAPWGGYDPIAALLRREAGDREAAPRRPYWAEPRVLLHEPGRLWAFPSAGLHRAVYDDLARAPDATISPRSRALRAWLAVSLATFDSVAGAPADARALLARARADVDAVGVSGDAEAARLLPDATRLGELDAAISLRAGDLAAARAALAPLTFADGERDTLPAFLAGETDGPPWTDSFDGGRRGWDDLGPGDGAAFVAARAGRHDNPFDASTLAFGARRLDRGREALAAWLSWGDRAPCWRCQSSSALAEVSHVAMTARALGRRDVQAEAERSLAAFRAALSRREPAVLALLIESM